MQNQLRGRARTDRLALHDEVEDSASPSYFQWCEQTVRTKAYKPVKKTQPKVNSFIRLFRRFG
jgi:hypothetical protein